MALDGIKEKLHALLHNGDSGIPDMPRMFPSYEENDRAWILKHQRDKYRDRKPANHVTAHIGVAGFFNLEMMAISKPNVGILLDINPTQEQVWNRIFEKLAKYKDPSDFLKDFIAHDLDELTEKSGIDGRKQRKLLKGVSDDVSQIDPKTLEQLGLSWLQDEEGYKYLHGMAKKGRLIAAKADVIHDEHMMTQLADFLKGEHIHVGDVYLSNIYDYMAVKTGGALPVYDTEPKPGEVREGKAVDDINLTEGAIDNHFTETVYWDAPNKEGDNVRLRFTNPKTGYDLSQRMMQTIRPLLMNDKEAEIYIGHIPKPVAEFLRGSAKEDKQPIVLDHEWAMSWQPDTHGVHPEESTERLWQPSALRSLD